jgi:ribose 5-phosphate isomerase A
MTNFQQLAQLGRSVANTVASVIRTESKNTAIIGIGTGSTVAAVIDELAKIIKADKLAVLAYTTSHDSTLRCSQAGITVCDPLTLPASISVGFDGADEVDPKKRVVKGKGGALLREKVVASVCKKFIICVAEEKLVTKLGEKTAVPVEIIPSAARYVTERLKKLGATSVDLRRANEGLYGPVVTESGNFILDARFSDIGKELENDIKKITGVFESGLFLTQASEVHVLEKSTVRIF